MNRALVAVLCVTLPATAALTAERRHDVKPGDSASAIAKRYYGDHELAELLLLYNGRRDPVIHPGETLRVPYCKTHRVRPGDTGSALADRYLGRASAWSVIARLNGLPPSASLQVGQSIVMPVVIPHALVRRETLAIVANRYYGDARRGEVLQSFNGIDDPRTLAVGQVVRVPLITLRLKAAPATTVTRSEPPKPAPEPDPPATPAWFEEGIGIAERAFDEGNYDRADERLTAMIDRIAEIQNANDRARLWRLRVFVDVAFDRGADACEAVRAAGAGLVLDPVRVSPKIREVVAGCAEDS